MTSVLEEHYGYLSDQSKIARYQAAIADAVKSDHVVMDLGCGTGLLGLMALRAGARKVIFVEEGLIITAARQSIADAGFAEKAEFHQLNSFELELAENVDIVICDHVGYFGFDYGILQLMADAKKRFLKPDGILIPESITVNAAPVDSEYSRKFVSQWQDDSAPQDFRWMANIAANSKHATTLEESASLSAAAPLQQFRLGEEQPTFLSWDTEFRRDRDGQVDGVAGWFDCALSKGLSMTNAPSADERLNRPQAFLPIECSIDVKAGDIIKASIMVRHLESIIAWTVEHPASGSRFVQSTFGSLMLDQQALSRSQPDRIAKLSDRGKARSLVLSYCDGTRTVADVIAVVQTEHPDLFATEDATVAFVTSVLAWDTCA